MTAPTCPKRMVFGPCGGVRVDGRCEVADHPCTFLDAPDSSAVRVGVGGSSAVHAGRTAPRPHTASREELSLSPSPPLSPSPSPPSPSRPLLPEAERMRRLIASRPIVVADLPGRALDAGSLQECARAVRGAVDAVLLGDSPRERVQFSPSLRAQLVQAEGVVAWPGVNARDRNRVAIEGELASLAVVGVGGVHVVTGDHPASGSRPDAMPVFDLDSTRMAALAAAAGHLVSVAEAPAAPPTDRRAVRLIGKVAAGAELCFVDHCGGTEAVARFIGDVTRLDPPTDFLGFVPCVPVVVDAESARLLTSFPGLVLPEGLLDHIADARDPRATGIDAAVRMSEELLALPGVVGVDLSGGPGPGGELAFAEALARVGERLGLS